MSVVVDTSVWIAFFAGETIDALETALAQGAVVLPPLVVAELISGAHRVREREAIADLVRDLSLHPTPVEHWAQVGELRARLRAKGYSISTPDAHVAQCAIDASAILLSRDAIFGKVSRHCELKVFGIASA